MLSTSQAVLDDLRVDERLIGKPTVYLAGPMTGIEDFNYPEFNRVAEIWRKAGWNVKNPAETDGGSTDKSYQFYLKEGLKALSESSMVALLPKWEFSRGAKMEVEVGLALGLDFYDAYTFKKIDPEFLTRKAANLVYGQRQKDYGPPEYNMRKTGRIWGAILDLPDIPPETVALMLAGAKVARESYLPKEDNRTDCIGYVLLRDDILKKVKVKEGTYELETVVHPTIHTQCCDNSAAD